MPPTIAEAKSKLQQIIKNRGHEGCFRRILIRESKSIPREVRDLALSELEAEGKIVFLNRPNPGEEAKGGKYYSVRNKKLNRKGPVRLVAEAAQGSCKSTWFTYLGKGDQDYVHSVVAVMIQNPDAPVHIVARKLIEELKITRTTGTVVRTLKEMISDAKKTT